VIVNKDHKIRAEELELHQQWSYSQTLVTTSKNEISFRKSEIEAEE